MTAPRAAYLHIPFCHRRCFYCDFAVVPLGDHADGAHSASIAAYLPLLQAEIAASPNPAPLSTVYIGGGTPSLLTPEQMGQLLEGLRQHFGFAPGINSSSRTREAGPAATTTTTAEQQHQYQQPPPSFMNSNSSSGNSKHHCCPCS